jgi:hypothetical protein
LDLSVNVLVDEGHCEDSGNDNRYGAQDMFDEQDDRVVAGKVKTFYTSEQRFEQNLMSFGRMAKS